MKILAKATAMLVPMAVPCICKYLRLFNWNEFSCKISLSAFPRKRLGMGCLLLSKVSCRVHFMFIPASCGIFM